MAGYETAIARVRCWAAGRPTTAGLGVLVGSGQVVTCAHVVNMALGREQRGQVPPGGSDVVQVEFPLLPGAPVREARIVAWLPPPGSGTGGGDVAGLELAEKAPADAIPARFAVAAPEPGTWLRVFGYPGRPPRPSGMNVDVDLKGQVGGQLLQVESRTGQTVKAQPGFSGSPVWDHSRGEVVGLLQSAPFADEPERDAYLLPPLAVAQAWEEPFGYLLVPQNPYRGLEPFTAEQAAVFFGRDADAALLTKRVLAQPVVVMVGPSGVGKSSLVQAGLIPALEKQQRWSVALIRPGRDPWQRLAAGVLRAQHGPDVAVRLEESRREVDRLRAEGLGPVARFLRSEDRPLLVVVDQFEELLVSGLDPDPGLLDLLLPPAEAAEDAMRLVVTLRADFQGALQAIPGFHTRLNDRLYLLSPLTAEQMREAVERPAVARKVAFEPLLVDKIVSDAAGGALPLLEFTLTKLWETQRRKTLTFAGYYKMGGVSGALDRFAQEKATSLADTATDVLDRALLRLVRTPFGGATLATRERVLQSEIPAAEWEALQRLAEARLVIVSTGVADHEPYAELAHESLITAWRRLRNLVAENAEFLDWLARVQQRAADGDLLLDARIAEARRWLDARPDNIPAAVRRFVESSETAAETRLRELQDARDRAEAAREQAQAAARRSLARALTHVVETTEDPVLALLLAIEVLKRSPDAQADRLVRMCLSRLGASEIGPISGEMRGAASNRVLRRLTLLDWSRGPRAAEHWLLGDPAAGLIVDEHGQAQYRADTVIPMPGPVVVAAYSRAGIACLGTEAGELAVWRLADRAEKTSGRDLGVPITSIGVSDTAQTLAVACDDGVIRMLRTEDLSDIACLSLPGFIRDVDVSTDRLVAALSHDRRICVWDLVSQEPFCKSPAGIGASPPLAVDLREDYVIVNDAVTGRISRFPVSAQALTTWAHRAAGRELTADERRHYIDDASA